MIAGSENRRTGTAPAYRKPRVYENLLMEVMV
jgi:hypothetical protein